MLSFIAMSIQIAVFSPDRMKYVVLISITVKCFETFAFEINRIDNANLSVLLIQSTTHSSGLFTFKLCFPSKN